MEEQERLQKLSELAIEGIIQNLSRMRGTNTPNFMEIMLNSIGDQIKALPDDMYGYLPKGILPNIPMRPGEKQILLTRGNIENCLVDIWEDISDSGFLTQIEGDYIAMLTELARSYSSLPAKATLSITLDVTIHRGDFSYKTWEKLLTENSRNTRMLEILQNDANPFNSELFKAIAEGKYETEITSII